MTLPHQLNLALHIGAGALAIALGLWILWQRKGDAAHRRLGRRFVRLTAVVCVTAIIGLAVWRLLPLFAVLTALVLYQLVSGWRVAVTQARGPEWPDLLWTLGMTAAAVPLVQLALIRAPQGPVIVLGSAGSLSAVLGYDLVRWAFPRAWHRVCWPIEHIYKLNAALFGMIAAFVGNTVRTGQPWSQLLPSVVGFGVIGYQIWRWQRRPAPSTAS